MTRPRLPDHAPGGVPWRVGESVPWSVAWSGEGSFSLQPSTDFPGLLDLVQAERPGEGVPRFAAVHVSRQRRAVRDLLCHVCGGPTHPGDRYLFPTHSGGFVTLHDGSQAYGANVPPVHGACAERARRQCPHLGGDGAEPVRFPDDLGRLVQRTDVAPGMEALAAQLPKNVEIAFSCYRLFGEAFSAQVLALLHALPGEPQIRAGRPGRR